MPIIIIKRFNSLEHGNSVEEAIAVAPDGFNAKDYVDHLNRQESLLRINIQRFIDIQRHVRSIFPSPENDEPLKGENARKNREWEDKYRSKVIELASSWIKDFPSDIISSFQEFGHLPSIVQCHYFYKEVPYAEYDSSF